jgi:RND family efflux transporter MFP subunit
MNPTSPPWKKRGKSRLGLLSLLALLAIVGCGTEEAAEKDVVRPVRAMKVSDVTGVETRSFPGRAKATQEVDLSFRVAGPLITRPVKVGDEVSQGDIVARIDPRDFEVELSNVKAQLAQARALLERAEADYRRLQSIFKTDPGATSEAAIDEARANRDRARANVDSLKAAVTSAEDQLSYTYLKAPFDGTVVATYVENFEDVRAKEAIVRLLDDSQIEMVVNIPESLISLSRYVTSVYVVFDAFPGHELTAKLKEVGTEASETTRTYPVTLIMEQPDDIKILAGMAGKTVRADLDLPEERRVTGLEVPVAATFVSEGKTHVWVIDEQTKTVSKREITTGELTDFGIKVLTGVKPGEWIATAGVNYLREGQQVRLLDGRKG